jgi:signal transduction histidine kinase
MVESKENQGTTFKFNLPKAKYEEQFELHYQEEGIR